MNTNHRIVVCSLPEYEDLVAEIYVDDQFIGLVSQETGRGNLVLELDGSIKKLPLNIFLTAVNAASRRLQEIG